MARLSDKKFLGCASAASDAPMLAKIGGAVQPHFDANGTLVALTFYVKEETRSFHVTEQGK
jgi:hypothetical protein